MSQLRDRTTERPEAPPRRRPEGVRRFRGRSRRAFVLTHRWLGLVLGLWIVIESLTGSAIVFGPEMDRALHRDDFRSTAGDVGMDDTVAATRAARPAEPVDSVYAPGENGAVYAVYTVDRDGEFHEVLVDPGSGRVNSADHHEPWVIEFLERVHFNLNSTSIVGLGATTVLGWLAIGWLLVLVSGVYVWYWPRVKRWANALRVRRTRGRFTFHLDLHNAVGIALMVPLTLVVLTGINFMFPAQVERAYNWATFGRYEPGDGAVAISQPQPRAPIGPGVAADVVSAVDDTVDVAFVDTPSGSPVGVYAVYASVDPSFLGMVGGERSVVFDVDQYTGQVLRVTDPAGENGATRAYEEWSYPVHAGTFGGVATRVLWVLLGIGPLVLAVTGVVMWIVRSRRRAPRVDDDDDDDDEDDSARAEPLEVAR